MKGDVEMPVGMNHAEVCSPILALDRGSAFLLQLALGAKEWTYRTAHWLDPPGLP